MISTLPEIQTTAGPETIVVHDPADNKSKRIAAGNFRGAGWFTEDSDNATPNTTFTGPAGHGPFKVGDMLRLTNLAGSATSLWYWDATLDGGNGDWAKFNDFTQATFHTSVSLAVNTYEIATVQTLNAAFTVGDFYRHLTLHRIYGPYHATNGFQFDPDARGYTSVRGPIQHVVATADLATRGVDTWSPWDITNKLEAAYAPGTGDTFLQRLTNINHGGYIWSWDEAAYLASATSPIADRTAGWGTKVFARQPETFTFATDPTAQDDAQFITGDLWKSVDTLDIWGPYVVGGADLAGSWGAVASIRGAASRIHSNTNVGVLARDDALYAADNDYMVDSEGSFFGPYVSGQATDLLAWPVLATGIPRLKTLAVDMWVIPDSEKGIPPRNDLIYNVGDYLIATYRPSGDFLAPILFGPYPPSGAWPFVSFMRSESRLEIELLTGTGGVYGANPPRNNTIAAIYETVGLPRAGDNLDIHWVFPEGHPTGTAGERSGYVDHLVIMTVDLTTGVVDYAGASERRVFRMHNYNAIGQPGRDDGVYETGDLIVDSQGSIYGPYVRTRNSDPEAWPTLALTPQGIAYVDEDGGTPADNYTPVRDDGAYKFGSFLQVNHTIGTINLPVLYGPYPQSGDWPEIGIMRAPVTFYNEMATGTGGVYGAFGSDTNADDQVFQTQGLPVEGDTLVRRHRYPTGHASGTGGELTGHVDKFNVTAVNRTTRAVTLVATEENVSTRFHINPVPGVLPRDDNHFHGGDFLIDDVGAFFGPYVEGAASDTLAWPLHVNPSAITNLTLTREGGSGEAYSMELDEQHRAYLLSATTGNRIYLGGGNEILSANTGDFNAVVVGATDDDPGVAGDVPAPPQAGQNMVLYGDGQWRSGILLPIAPVYIKATQSGDTAPATLAGTFNFDADCIYAEVEIQGSGGGQAARNWTSTAATFVHMIGSIGSPGYAKFRIPPSVFDGIRAGAISADWDYSVGNGGDRTGTGSSASGQAGAGTSFGRATVGGSPGGLSKSTVGATSRCEECDGGAGGLGYSQLTVTAARPVDQIYDVTLDLPGIQGKVTTVIKPDINDGFAGHCGLGTHAPLDKINQLREETHYAQNDIGTTGGTLYSSITRLEADADNVRGAAGGAFKPGHTVVNAPLQGTRGSVGIIKITQYKIV